jgi:hypothetical protein
MAVLDKEFTYAPPGTTGSPVPVKERYDNFIGGQWVAPVNGHGSLHHRGAAINGRGRRARA